MLFMKVYQTFWQQYEEQDRNRKFKKENKNQRYWKTK